MRDNKLYNVLFPAWFLILFPVAWLIILPGNFIIDSLVLIISLMILKIKNKKEIYKKNILKIFSFGIIADVIGAAYMFIMVYLFEIGIMGDELYITIPGLVISGIMIFIFNYFISFRKLDKSLRLKLAIIFAVVTSPYTFLIPTSWLY